MLHNKSNELWLKTSIISPVLIIFIKVWEQKQNEKGKNDFNSSIEVTVHHGIEGILSG